MNAERAFLHDISSPLTSVMLNLENAGTLLEGGKPEEIGECIKLLDSCLNQVKRATEMIRARREVLIREESAKEGKA